MSSSFVVEREVALCVNAQVVHIYFQPSFSDHVSEDVIHKGLKGGGLLQNPKNMTVGLKSPKGVMNAPFH